MMAPYIKSKFSIIWIRKLTQIYVISIIEFSIEKCSPLNYNTIIFNKPKLKRYFLTLQLLNTILLLYIYKFII